MSELAARQPRTFDDPLDDDAGVSASAERFFERLWHVFISMRTGLALILFLALLGGIGTLLIQAPAGLSSDPASYAAWLDSVRPRFGGWTGVMDTLGLFNIFTSLWFRGTVVLLSASILACSVNRTPKLWRQAVHPRTVASAGFFEHAALSASVPAGAEVEVAADAVARQLAGRHFRVLRTPTADGIAVYADRFRWGPYGTVIAHLSLIVILAGGMLGTTGFRSTDFAVTVGSTVDVGHDTGLSVQAVSFSDSYYDNGEPADYASHLVVYKAGQQVADQTIRVNDPLRVDDVTFYQSFFGPAADVSIADATGNTVYQGGVALEWASTDGSKSIGEIDLPAQDLTVYVIGVASGLEDPIIKPGQMQVEAYQGSNFNTPLDLQIVSQGQPATVAGLQFTFERERQFTGLIVARDPGAPLVWLGALLLIAGVGLVFFFPVRRIWAFVRRDGETTVVDVAAASLHDIAFRDSFRALVDKLELALPDAGDAT
jgi:cytochrome c biogenesis protein